MAFIQHQPRRAAAVAHPPDHDDEVATSTAKGKGKSKEVKAIGKGNATSQIDHNGDHLLRHGGSHLDDGSKDWSIVFPGRAAKTTSSSPASQGHSPLVATPPIQPDAAFYRDSAVSASLTPFLSEDDLDEVKHATAASKAATTTTTTTTTLPPLHDGTGRFAGPALSVDVGGEELASTSSSSSPLLHRRTSASRNALLHAPSSDSITLGSLSEDEELDLHDDVASMASSNELFSETESEMRSRMDRRQRRASMRASRDLARSSSITADRTGSRHLSIPPSSMRPGSASWAWMHAPQNQQPQLQRRGSELSVVFTSDSENEAEDAHAEMRRPPSSVGAGVFDSAYFVELDDSAFEEALANTHWAQSAGLRARSGRVPKRRHRRNGESEKGSKRSNNSAALLGSDIRSAVVLSGTSAAALLRDRRQALSSRRSNISAVSTRARLRLQQAQQKKSAQQRGDNSSLDLGASGAQSSVAEAGPSRGQRFVNSILRRMFGIDDDEVLAAFLHNEGPLRIEPSASSAAIPREGLPSTADFLAASASRDTFGARPDVDEVWSRTHRNRRMRLLLAGEEYSAYDQANDDGDSDGDNSSHQVHRVPKGDAASGFRPPYRVHVTSNVAEPSLVEALQASVLSGLRVLPSGLSMLMAGSHSVRLVNYLVGRIGPQFTERVRKLLDDEGSAVGGALSEAGSGSANTEQVGRARSATLTSSDESSVRLTGPAHPALSANSGSGSPRR